MDIWRWVSDRYDYLISNDQSKLAEYIYETASACCDNKHEKFDQIYPEALFLAKNLNDKELELYFRHWNLQSQVLRRNNVNGLLDETIDLLDFSHQADLKHCPQRVCAVQDLAAAYGIKDGPGFAEERIAVCEEIYPQITPNWPCFDCISVEHAHALIDQKKFKEAQFFLDHQQTKRLANGKGKMESELATTYALVLVRLNDFDEALSILDNAKDVDSNESFLKMKSLITSLIYVNKQQFNRARDQLLSFDDVKTADSHYLLWVEVIYSLANQNEYELNEVLLRQLHFIAHNYQIKGAIRKAIQINNWIVSLSISHRALCSAQLAVDRSFELLPELQLDLGAKDKVNAQLEDVKQLFESLKTNANYEVELSDDDFEKLTIENKYLWYLLSAGSNDLEQRAIRFADCCAFYYRADYGLEGIKNVLRCNPNRSGIYFELGSYILNALGNEVLISEFENFDIFALEDDAKLDCYWLLGLAYGKSDVKKAINYFSLAHQIKPESINLKVRLANAYMDAKDFEKAKTLQYEVSQKNADDKNIHWDLLVSGSATMDWECVRKSSDILGFKLSSTSGHIEEEWEIVLLDFGDGEKLWARRTGPVTAKITSIVSYDKEQLYDTEVVFNPTPLNELDQLDEDGDKCDQEGFYHYIFQVATTITRPEYYTFELSGFRPLKEKLDTLVGVVSELGCIISIRNSDEYEITYEKDIGNGQFEEMSEKGLYALILVPVDPESYQIEERLMELNDKLKEQTKRYTLPLVWPHLLRGLQETPENKKQLREQLKIESTYGL